MNYRIKIIEIITKNNSGHYIALTDEDGNLCSEREYENFLYGIGAECIKRY